MSLILRQQCQPVLNDYGLGDYHTRINPNKYLAITGPCGKPLFSISGIEFVRNQPTAKEIDFAVELLTDFCLTHATTIKLALLAKKTLFNAKKPVIPEGYTCQVDNYIISKKIIDDFELRFNTNTKQTSFYIHRNYSTTPISLATLTKIMSKPAIDKMQKIYDEQKAYADLEKAYNDQIAALQTCNI